MKHFFTLTVVTSSGNSEDRINSGTTCLSKIAESWSLFSGFSKSCKVSDGILANASFVGAKTVNGPSPLSVSTKSAAVTAST